MPPVSLMIKPASSNCNLRCEYCFYHDVAESRTTPSRGVMRLELLEDIIKKAVAFTKGEQIMISFQGGEPLLAGKDFFYAFLEMLPRLNVYNSPVSIGIQTNGTLIDEEWCDIFLKGNFLVGLSLDGTEKTNSLRIDANGNPTFDSIYNSAKLLQRKGVEFNILTVLTKPIAENIEEIYAFYKENAFKHLQFIPCLKPLNNEQKPLDVNVDFFLTAEDYFAFLVKAFALYSKDYREGNYTSIRQFDNFVLLAHFERAEQCGMNGHCTHQYVIEGDGEVYPCDFYCTDKYSLGYIQDTDFFALEKHPTAVNFIKESLVVLDKCHHCKYFLLCRNGCKRERIDIDKCSAYKKFFPLAIPELKKMF